MLKIDEIKARMELEQKILEDKIQLDKKVLEEIEQFPEVLEVERLFKEIEKVKSKMNSLKDLKKIHELELSAKLLEVQPKLSKEVFEALYGTVEKSVETSKVPKLDTIKMCIVSGLLEGRTVQELSKEIYPDRAQDKKTNFLIYRQVQEVEKDGCVKIVQKPTSENNYTNIKIEKVGNW